MKHSTRVSMLFILLNVYGFGAETKVAQEQFSLKLNSSLPQNQEPWTWAVKYSLENNHTGGQFSNYELK
ncbi:unnamed protein product, partial [Allacma fusca]